jgi:hypothetical protein
MSENENTIENTDKTEVQKRKAGRPRKTYTKEELKDRLIHFREYQKEFQKKAYHKKIHNKTIKIDDDDTLLNYSIFKNYDKAF